MKYQFNLGLWNKVFAVPSCVVEKYIKLASGKAIKVLLYLLCNRVESDTKDIANALGISEEEAEEAVLFWNQLELMEAVADTEPVKPLPEITEKPTEKEAPKPKAQDTAPLMTPIEIARRVEEDEEMKFLFAGAESIYGDILNHTKQRSLIWMRDYLGLPADMLLMLMEYCKSVGKLNVRYIEKMAVSWYENGILTHEAADEEITRLKKLSGYQAKVKEIFGLQNRNLSSQQEQYISDWSRKCISLDLVSYAYDKAMDNQAKKIFNYVDSILQNWYVNGLDTREKIDKEQPAKAKNSTPVSESSYDLDLFDKLAVNYPADERSKP